MKLSFRTEEWALERPFKISRSTITCAKPFVVELSHNGFTGRGESEIHESDDAVIAAAVTELEALRPAIEHAGFNRADLQNMLANTPLRNALDCALWDLEAKQSNTPVWKLAGLSAPKAVTTVYTISVDDPEIMAEQASGVAHMPMLKLKLKGQGDLERVAAVRKAAPKPRLIIDANEAWTIEELQEFGPELHKMGVELIEQPLPQGADEALRGFKSPVPLCADESCHDTRDIAAVKEKYQFANIKLDKTGGLTEAIALMKLAQENGMGLMVGCMVGTSLAMAPAMLVAANAKFVDLDGPLLLKDDRPGGLTFNDGIISPLTQDVWG